jgi:hypothetical protein
MRSKFSRITGLSPSFAAALLGYRRATASGDNASSDALLAWVAQRLRQVDPQCRSSRRYRSFSALCVFSASLRSGAGSEAVALRHPVVPIANGLGRGFVGI